MPGDWLLQFEIAGKRFKESTRRDSGCWLMHKSFGACLDLASPTRDRIVATFNCSLSAGRTLPLGRKSLG